jgi:DNA-binding response OmpR family regulator
MPNQQTLPASPQPASATTITSAPAAAGRRPLLRAVGSGEAPPAEGHALRIDREQWTAHIDGTQLDLTYLEFELLAHLVAHPGRVHTREQLVATVWGYAHVGDGRTVDVHIARLRRKLGPRRRASIVTVRRVGYKYLPQPR